MSTAQLAAIVLTIHDGTEPLVPPPFAAPIFVPQSTDAEIPYSAVGDNGESFDLTGWAVTLVVRGEWYEIDPPPIAHQQVPATISTGVFPIGATDTTPMDLRTGGYRVSFEATNPAGKRFQVRGPTQFFVTEAESRPSTDVTTPTGYPPQGQGPSGASINWRGAYDPALTYATLDAVSYEIDDVTSSYIAGGAISTDTPPPSGAWSLMASGATLSTDVITRSIVCLGTVAGGTFGKTGAGGKVSQLLTTDNVLLRTCIILSDGTDGDSVTVVQIGGQQVTMTLDDAGGDAIAGTFAYYSGTVNGALTATDPGTGTGVAGIFQTDGTAGVTADILS